MNIWGVDLRKTYPNCSHVTSSSLLANLGTTVTYEFEVQRRYANMHFSIRRRSQQPMYLRRSRTKALSAVILHNYLFYKYALTPIWKSWK
ncbi:8707_t:CDS:2 [Paraglomus brasilianum]|uniref:8707_t:CDS:1 n=1 Tax=Paraglomus brasilianum TaxID=144538 RepID=A0A9N9A0Z2_9GLOM|nr:8707_t:CDS:2 [Paraglomus brasilianum]